eukprot:g77026.t1
MLSTDLLAHAFSFLPTISLLLVLPRVCRAWFDAVNHSGAWEMVQFSRQPRVSGLHLAYLCRLWSQVVKLDLTGCVGVTDDALCLLLLRAVRLRSLSLSGCLKLTDRSLGFMGQLCPGALSAAESKPSSFQHTQSWHVSPRMRTAWQELRLDRLAAVTDVGLISLSRVCGELKLLSLSDCEEVSDKGLQAIAKVCSALTTLSLARTAITDKGLAYLAAKCRRLRHLNLSGCPTLSDSSITHLIAKCAQLRSLSLSGTEVKLGSEVFLGSSASHWAGLTRLDLSKTQVQDAAIGRLALACPCLEHLHLNWNMCLTDQAIGYLCGYEHKQADPQTWAEGFHDADLLEGLPLRSCPERGSCGLDHQRLFGHGVCYDLVEPDPAGGRSFSSRSRSRGGLARAGRTSGGEDRGVLGCFQLRTLVLTKCVLLTDRAPRQIGARLRLLERLELRGCHQLTQQGIAHLLACPNLKYLDVRGCYELGAQTLKGFPAGSTLEQVQARKAFAFLTNSLKQLVAGTKPVKKAQNVQTQWVLTNAVVVGPHSPQTPLDRVSVEKLQSTLVSDWKSDWGIRKDRTAKSCKACGLAWRRFRYR